MTMHKKTHSGALSGAANFHRCRTRAGKSELIEWQQERIALRDRGA